MQYRRGFQRLTPKKCNDCIVISCLLSYQPTLLYWLLYDPAHLALWQFQPAIVLAHTDCSGAGYAEYSPGNKCGCSKSNGTHEKSRKNKMAGWAGRFPEPLITSLKLQMRLPWHLIPDYLRKGDFWGKPARGMRRLSLHRPGAGKAAIRPSLFQAVKLAVTLAGQGFFRYFRDTFNTFGKSAVSGHSHYIYEYRK